jgi:hypothetical protein
MNDREREERSIWKLEQAGYRVRRQADRYLVTTAESVTELDDLAQLAAFADVVYAEHWTHRRMTPSAYIPDPGTLSSRPSPCFPTHPHRTSSCTDP